MGWRRNAEKYVPRVNILIIYVPPVCARRIYGPVHFSHAFVHLATFRRYLFLLEARRRTAALLIFFFVFSFFFS